MKTIYRPQFADFGLTSARLMRFHPSVPPMLRWLLPSGFVVFTFYSISHIIYNGRSLFRRNHRSQAIS